MSKEFYTLLSVLIVSLLSFSGALTLSIKKDKLKNILIYLVSFSAGALIGDIFFHILPEIIEKKGFSINISIFILLGLLSFFILEKLCVGDIVIYLLQKIMSIILP